MNRSRASDKPGTKGLISIDCSSILVPYTAGALFSLPGKLMKVLLGGELLSEMVKGTVYTSGARYGMFRDRLV